MTYEEAKEYINGQEPTFLSKDRRKKGFVCPICNNGTGSDGDGISRKDGHYKCFKCDMYADVIDLIGLAYGLDNFKDKVMKGCEIYGIKLDNKAPANNYKQTKEVQEVKEEKKTENLTEYFNKCHQTLKENYKGSYLESRGISLETAERFNIGLDKEFITGKNVWQALIIPTGIGSYNARNTDKNADNNNRYRKHNSAELFNIDALKEEGNVFITEGEIDAISVIEAGFNAVGLGSTSGKRPFIEYIKESTELKADTITLILDNDEAGQKTAEEIKDALKSTEKVKVFVINPYDECKDANECLQKNRKEFTETLKQINADPITYERIRCLKKTTDILNEFEEDIRTRKPAISTGFEELDECLGGGLYEDFYILQAGTGLGKTTLLLQMADNIAKNGTRVLFYNLEMSNYELIARSISRESYNISMKNYNNGIMGALSSRVVMDGQFNIKQRETYEEATNTYKEYCNNVVFHETIGYYDTGKIDEEVNAFTRLDGKAPVVMVDYLQMLSLGIAIKESKSFTERQAIDKALLDLKGISRRYGTPVIALSSISRSAEESDKLKQSAGKESGSIEYTAGTLLAMDYKAKYNDDNTLNKNFKEYEEAQKGIREMRIFIHKNRHCKPKQAINFDYKPMFNFFFEEPQK